MRPDNHFIAVSVTVDSMMAEMFAKKDGCYKEVIGTIHICDISSMLHLNKLELHLTNAAATIVNVKTG
jgi:TPP-dependent pyruvate/acetoin dehydrogenase alpha subunit